MCGGKLDAALRCATCGAAYGEANRCLHCGSVADIEESSSLRQRCKVCGGPRVPVDDASLVRTGREREPLRKARAAHARASAWRAGSVVVAAFGALTVLVTLLVLLLVSPGWFASIVALAAALVPVLVAVYGLRRGTRFAAERERALDDAWALVASDVVRDRGRAIDARELGRLMRLREEQAELLLGRLNVEDYVRARVTDAGDLVYESVRARVESPEAEDLARAADAPGAGEAERLRR